MDFKKPVNILLPYEGKTVLASIEEDAGLSLTPQFFIKFPDGYKNSFFPIDTDNEDDPANELWGEENLGITELSTALTPILDEFLATADYIEPYIETVNGQVYFIQPFGAVDLIFFKIYHDGEYLFSLQVGEDAQWEIMQEESDPVGSQQQPNTELVAALGDLIDKKNL